MDEKKETKIGETKEEKNQIANHSVQEVKEEKIEQKEELKFQPVETKENKRKKMILASILGCAILLILVLFSTIFALMNINNDKIIKGVSVKGIDISNLSKEEATQKLNDKIEEKLSKDIALKCEEFTTTINPEQIEAKFDVEKAVDLAYKVGREGNIITNNYRILKTMIGRNDIDMTLNYNQDQLNAQLEDINSKLPNPVKESSYYIDDEELILTKGSQGNVIKIEELETNIKNRLNEISKNEEEINIPVENKTPEEINIEKIYEEVHKEPQDAYYTKNPFKVYPHVDGVDFAISIEEAKQILQEDKDEYVIPLNITKPKVTTDKIGSEAFPDLISTFSTKYDASNKSRSTNLALAAGKINGTVVLPGDTFSYNKVVGERSIAAGYKEAKIYENGQVVDGLGGGICQISSTLYNTAVYANLEIVIRRNHQFLTSYVGAGRDATVVYGATDFKFKNTRQFPIRIVASVKNGIAKIDFYGIKEENEPKVEFRTSVTGSIPYSTTYIEDPTMEAGKEIVKQRGTNGCKSETYKVVTINGKVVSNTILSKDTYNAMQRVIIRGTKTAISTQAPQEQTPPIENVPTQPDLQTETAPPTTDTPETE